MQESVPQPRNVQLIAGLLVLAALTYWPSLQALWEFWTNDNTAGAHGLLVAPLAAWLLYRARHRLALVPVRPSLGAGVMLVMASVAWLVFWRAGIQELEILALPVLMGLSVYAALGWQAARSVAFPIGYLYFAVPAWGIFIGPLEQLTTAAVGVLAPLIGIPAHTQGDLILIPGGIIEVARGCSGQAFLTVGLAVAALLGELGNGTLLWRVVLFVVMGALAVLSNWIRVLVIVEAGYTTHMRHVLITRGHFLFGWILFTSVMVAFVWLLAGRLKSVPAATPTQGERRPTRMMPTYVAAVVALVAVPLVVYTFVLRLDVSAAPVTFEAPAGRGEWRGPVSAPNDAWQPVFVGAHSQWYFAYEGPSGHNVQMVAIGYPMQAQGRELVNEENSLFGVGAPEPAAEVKITLDGESYIELVAADQHGQRWLTWSVYDIGGREFVTPLFSQLWYGLRSLGGPPYSMQFAFRTECSQSCDAARGTLRSFLKTMHRDCFASVGRSPQSPTSRPL
jgi:EpsI family protein